MATTVTPEAVEKTVFWTFSSVMAAAMCVSSGFGCS